MKEKKCAIDFECFSIPVLFSEQIENGNNLYFNFFCFKIQFNHKTEMSNYAFD